ncbi:hypothetical protein HB943_05340 [Listeria weihenstephanensis]|uniref:Conjugal transfer protein n=1 Tax=Listeria weihenstephanensis TaxID=1006155 RepID=A0A841Z424_9LIST|nr:hypothetical protein [Listeria weihenstephanensis]MBC1500020.1 hypothetical protein [Listeria weihenstephanensis]
MLKKGVAMFCLILLCLSFGASSIHAEVPINPNPVETQGTGENATKPKIVRSGGVVVEYEKYPMSRYQINNEAEEAKIKGAFVGLSNILMAFARVIATLVDTALEKLFSLDPIGKFGTTMSAISKSMYDSLKTSFAGFLYFFLIAYVAFIVFLRNNLRDAGRRLIMFVVVMVVGGYWMLNSDFWVKTFNNVSVEAQGKLISATDRLLNMGTNSKDSMYSVSNQVAKGEESKGTVAILRNVYFDLAVKKPYLIANYGTTSEEKINAAHKGTKGDLSRVDTLLSFKLSEAGQKEKLDYVKKQEVDSNDNETMASGNVFSQMGIALIAPIAAIALAVPFLAVALMSFLLQYIALLILFALPVMFLISIVPQMSMSGFKGLGYLVATFVLKAFIVLLVALLYAICFMMNEMLPPTGFGMYLLNFLVTVFILIMLIVKRNAVVKFLTAGRVERLDGKVMDNVNKEMLQPAWEGTKKGWEATKKTTHGAGFMINRAAAGISFAGNKVGTRAGETVDKFSSRRKQQKSTREAEKEQNRTAQDTSSTEKTTRDKSNRTTGSNNTNHTSNNQQSRQQQAGKQQGQGFSQNEQSRPRKEVNPEFATDSKTKAQETERKEQRSRPNTSNTNQKKPTRRQQKRQQKQNPPDFDMNDFNVHKKTNKVNRNASV